MNSKTNQSFAEFLVENPTATTYDYEKAMNDRSSADAAADRAQRERISREQESQIPQR